MEISLLLLESEELPHVPIGITNLSIVIGDKRWLLSNPLDDSKDHIPPYICVSYTREDDLVENTIHNGVVMSDHAILVLESATHAQDIHAVWIDAFCIPTDQEKKQQTLLNMGYIYANAQRVVVVLPETTWGAMDEIMQMDIDAEMAKVDGFPARTLEIIDADDWIRNALTYREAVKSPELSFMGQISRKEIERELFFSQFSRYLWAFGKTNNKNPFDIRQEYPYVDTLEDVLLDWRLSQGPSAFTVISRVHRRIYRGDEDYFYSIIGVMADEPLSQNIAPSISDLAEKVLELCEQKGDFSFIFCSNDRDTHTGLRWRPYPGKLRPIVGWASYGVKQGGSRIPGGVVLQDMYLLTNPTDATRALDNSTKVMLSRFLHLTENEPSDEQMANTLLEKLRIMDYSGTRDYWLCDEGMFFPQHELPSYASVAIWVSMTIRWVFGSPGIAIVKKDSSSEFEFIPGVFAGAFADLASGTEVQLLG